MNGKGLNLLKDGGMLPWSCRCGTDANWASRAKCRSCGADAPRKVLAAIASSEKRPKPGTPAQPSGKWRQGAPGTDQNVQRKVEALEKQVSALRGENKTLKSAASSEAAPPIADTAAEDEGVDIGALQKFYDTARKLFGEEDVQSVTAKERLDHARTMANGKKPLAKRFNTLEFKIKKAKKNKQNADEEVLQTEKAIAGLQAKLEKQQVAVLSKAADLEAAEKELKNLINLEAADDGVVNVDDPFAGMCKS